MRSTRSLSALAIAIVLMGLGGCATLSFPPNNPTDLAGAWKASGPEFQDYYFDVVVIYQQPRLKAEPKARFKNEEAEARYNKKYGYRDKLADAFTNALNSLSSIASIGEPLRTYVDEVDQAWNPHKGELVWTKTTYASVGGNRDANPTYVMDYTIDFESVDAGTMHFDGKDYDLERLR